MISKNKIYNLVQQLNVDNNYMLGIIKNKDTQELKVGMIVNDLIKSNEEIVLDYKQFDDLRRHKSTLQDVTRIVYDRVRG